MTEQQEAAATAPEEDMQQVEPHKNGLHEAQNGAQVTDEKVPGDAAADVSAVEGRAVDQDGRTGDGRKKEDDRGDADRKHDKQRKRSR